MSWYSTAKEISNDILNVNQVKNLTWKINRILNVLMVLLVCLIYLLDECNMRTVFVFDEIIIMPENVKTFLEKWAENIYYFTFVYYIIINPVIKIIVIGIEEKTKKDVLLLWETIGDAYEIFSFGIVCLKLVNDILSSLGGSTNVIAENKKLYLIIVLIAMLRFVGRIYAENENRRYYIKKKYTQFFDSNGKRIPMYGRVIYYNKIHKLHKEKENWYLTEDRNGFHSTAIRLDDAVKDVDGKLKVYEFGMGEKE